jgi:hypothetical protein
MVAAQSTGLDPPTMAAAKPPVRIVTATDAGSSRRRVSTAPDNPEEEIKVIRDATRSKLEQRCHQAMN